VQRAELESLEALHPLQVPWYQASTFAALRQEAVFPIDGDVLIGPGVALLATPGHTIGNHTLVVNTETGIWASSENVIAAECLTPEHSRIPACAATRAPGTRRSCSTRTRLEDTAAAVQLVRTREIDRRRRARRPTLSAVHALVRAHRHRAQPGNVADVHALRDLPRHVVSNWRGPILTPRPIGWEGVTLTLARRAWTLFEPIHAIVYFAPEASEHYKAAGLRGGWMGYFASRSAPMGAVTPGVVTAVFHGFQPAMVARAIPDAWHYSSPEGALKARTGIADSALRRLWSDQVESADVAQAASAAIARRAEPAWWRPPAVHGDGSARGTTGGAPQALARLPPCFVSIGSTATSRRSPCTDWTDWRSLVTAGRRRIRDGPATMRSFRGWTRRNGIREWSVFGCAGSSTPPGGSPPRAGRCGPAWRT